MDSGKYTFVIDVRRRLPGRSGKGRLSHDPGHHRRDRHEPGRPRPFYIQRIITSTVTQYWSGQGKPEDASLVQLETRARFNPNMQQSWFVAVNQLINNVSVLAIFLTGAAVLRETRTRQSGAPAGDAA
jgi:ABC-2 type transport system permease protein